MIQALGEKGPEWELENVGLKEELHGLSSEVDEVVEVDVAVEGGWQGLLDGWVIGKAEDEPSNSITSLMTKSDDVKIERLTRMDPLKGANDAKKEADLDSDDDDLPAFDMFNDTPVTEETKVTLKTLSFENAAILFPRFQSYTSETSFNTSLIQNPRRCEFRLTCPIGSTLIHII